MKEVAVSVVAEEVASAVVNVVNAAKDVAAKVVARTVVNAAKSTSRNTKTTRTKRLSSSTSQLELISPNRTRYQRR